VYGELSRKHKQLSGQIDQLAKAVNTLVERSAQKVEQRQPQRYDGGYTPAPAPQQAASPYGAPRLLSGYSDEQLNEALRAGGLTPDNQTAVRTELSLRERERWFDNQFATRERQKIVNDLKQRSEKAAYDSFPALRDPESELSRRVEAELQEQRRLIGEVPTDKLDVANRVALQMGVRGTRVFAPGYAPQSDGGESTRESSKPKTKPILSDGQIDSLSKKFASTMPYDTDPKTGMPVRRKFNTKRIRENAQQYAEGADAMYGRGVRVDGDGQ
jgi:hypothetical protein